MTQSVNKRPVDPQTPASVRRDAASDLKVLSIIELPPVFCCMCASAFFERAAFISEHQQTLLPTMLPAAWVLARSIREMVCPDKEISIPTKVI